MSMLAVLTVMSGGGEFGGGVRSGPDCCCLDISVKMPDTSLLFTCWDHTDTAFRHFKGKVGQSVATFCVSQTTGPPTDFDLTKTCIF